MSKFLFDSIEAAQEMAYMLQAEWDGCNGIVLSQIDDAAIETAAGLCSTVWCQPFDKCKLPLLQREELGGFQEKKYLSGRSDEDIPFGQEWMAF